MSVSTPPLDELVSHQLLEQSALVEEELMAARAAQRFYLPPDVVQTPACTLSYLYQPLHHIGGDFVDVLTRPDGSVVWMVADVAGHGIAAALATAMVKTTFVRHAPLVTGPAQVLTALNRELEGIVRGGRFITALAGVFQPSGRRLTMASAGHPGPVLVHQGKAAKVAIEADHPLFVSATHIYTRTTEMSLTPGDRLVAYTDGLVDGERKDQSRLGVAALCDLIAPLPTGGAPEYFVQSLYEALFLGEFLFSDDVTILSLDCH